MLPYRAERILLKAMLGLIPTAKGTIKYCTCRSCQHLDPVNVTRLRLVDRLFDDTNGKTVVLLDRWAHYTRQSESESESHLFEM